MKFATEIQKETYKKVYEQDEYNVKNIARDYDIILDLGASIGDFALLCLENGAKRVVSVECFKINYDCLIENCKDSRFEPIYGFITAPPYPYDNSHIECTTDYFILSDFLNQNSGKKILLKFDIEGWEYLAFKHALDEGTFKNVSYAIGEYHFSKTPDLVKVTNDTEVTNFFNSLGMKVTFQVRATEYILGMVELKR